MDNKNSQFCQNAVRSDIPCLVEGRCTKKVWTQKRDDDVTHGRKSTTPGRSSTRSVQFDEEIHENPLNQSSTPNTSTSGPSSVNSINASERLSRASSGRVSRMGSPTLSQLGHTSRLVFCPHFRPFTILVIHLFLNLWQPYIIFSPPKVH